VVEGDREETKKKSPPFKGILGVGFWEFCVVRGVDEDVVYLPESKYEQSGV
jgi:hypothetical protein